MGQEKSKKRKGSSRWTTQVVHMLPTISDVLSAPGLVTCRDENVGIPGRGVIHVPLKTGTPHDHRRINGLREGLESLRKVNAALPNHIKVLAGLPPRSPTQKQNMHLMSCPGKK